MNVHVWFYPSIGGLTYSHMPSCLTLSSCLIQDTYASRDWISVRLGTYTLYQAVRPSTNLHGNQCNLCTVAHDLKGPLLSDFI